MDLIASLNVAPYSYLKFWVFYATFGLAKFTTNTIKAKQSHNLEESQNVLNYQCVKKMIQSYYCHGNYVDFFLTLLLAIV